MKISTKHIATWILCIIIAFIPTYIAITYYFVKDSTPSDGYYKVLINDQNGEKISIKENDVPKVAKMILNMNQKLYAAGTLEADTLPSKYYDITVVSKDFSVSYRYYFSVDNSRKTIARSKDGGYYFVEFSDTKKFLSSEYAYNFYDTAKTPVISIFGGNDVIPTEAEWKYKSASGSMVSLDCRTAPSDSLYAMNSTTKMSFNIKPDKCSVRVFQNGKEIADGSSLDVIPYSKLENGSLSFEIYAEWNSKEYSGYARYKFKSTVGLAPEFFTNTTEILSGEFFLVYAKNITAPEKIQFSSSPAINFSPAFFKENDMVYALIPIDKNLDATEYEFSFSYGEKTSKINVTVEERTIYDRTYDVSNISVSRDAESIKEYYDLLSSIGLKYEQKRYFSDKFDDYSMMYESDIANIILGYGHRRNPSSNGTPFRLDGVDYFIASGTNVTAIASGKVVYVGECELLGRFIVIDHGLGLKTWYCNLSETNITDGATVAKGDMIGKPGETGYKNTNGVYLITTVMNIPVSPYPLQENGLTLPK